MAEEIKKVVSVDVSKAVEDIKSLSDELEEMDGDILDNIKTFKDYKNVIERLSVSLSKMDEDTDEYEKTLTDLNKVQNAYNEAMSVSKKKTDDAAGSYNALSKEMSELKKQFKATNDESERQKIGEKIVSINDKLKEMDASIGNYQRNVGNYSSAFTDGLSKIGEKFVALNNPMALAKKGVLALNGAFKVLIANPIGAIITAIVVTVKALVAAFKSNEEASNKLKMAFSAFEPVINAVKNALGYVVNIIGDALIAISKLAEGVQSAGVKIVELLNKIGLVSDERLKSIKDNIAAQKDALSESRKLSEEEIALEQRKRDEMVKTAEKNAEISELKAKAAETDKYTNEERNKFLKRAVELEKEINEERLAIAKQEFDIAQRRAAQAPNSKEDNEKLAQAEANYYNVKREYTDKIKELNGQIASSSKSVSSAISEEAKTLQKASDIIEQTIDEILNVNFDELSNNLDNDLKKIDEIQNKLYEESLSPEQLKLKKLDEEYQESLALYEKYGLSTLELTRRYETKKAEIIKEINDKIAEDKKKTDEKEKEAKIAEIEELAEKREEYSQMANDISIILGSIGDGWESLLERQYETGKLSEKEYKRRQKALQAFQIASIVGQSASAIFDLWSGYAKETAVINTEGAAPAGPAAPAVKAALDAKSLISTIAKTATITSTAATQIAAIKSSSSGSSVSSGASGVSGGSAASVSSGVTSYSPSYSQTVMGKSDMTSLQNAVSQGTQDGQQKIKVFVTTQDIIEKVNEVKTIVEESTF